MMAFPDLLLLKANSIKAQFIILFALSLLFVFNTAKTSHAFSKESKIAAAKEQIRNAHQFRRKQPDGDEPLYYLNGTYTGNNPQLKVQLDLEKKYGPEVSENLGYFSYSEPMFQQIQFYKLEKPATLNARIDALLHGVTLNLPPKYDLHGYELRRYMAKIGGPEVYSSKERLREEMMNIQRAEIILDDWRKQINAEIKEIEALIETDQMVSYGTRESFKFNRGKARAFLVEAGSWVKNNKKTLDVLFKLNDNYSYNHPAFNFNAHEDLTRFKNHYTARQKALRIIQKYPSFRMMVY